MKHSSGSEGDFADDDELSDEERKGKRSVSPGHARDTDCYGKAGVVSIISIGNVEVNGDSQFGRSDDEEDGRVENLLKMREETRSEAEIRKTTKHKSNQSSGDVVEAESIASCVKGHLSGDLSRVSEELNRLSADLSQMATELKNLGAAFSSFQTSIVSNVQDMLKTFHADMVQNVTNPMILSPAPTMQHVPASVAVNSCNFTNLEAYKNMHDWPDRMETHMRDGMVQPTAAMDVRSSGEDLFQSSDPGINDVVTQPTALRHGGVDASKIIENALLFADNAGFADSNVCILFQLHFFKEWEETSASVNGSQPSPNGSAAEEELSLDLGLLFTKPTFLLGLSQEDPNNINSGCDVVNEESCEIALNKDDGVTVQEGDAPCHPFRKRKRQKVVPKALVGDYECDKKFLTRAWEAHVAGNRTGDDIEAEAKYCKLREILKTPFSFIVNGVKIESKDLSVMVEKSANVPTKVVDVLIHHTRSVYNGASD
ncbi:hypothetical protein Bca4012_009927 [Brassica carinata]